MKDALFIIICLLIIQQLHAQSIRDSVFNDVILINEKDVTMDGSDFLIDISIKPQKEPLVIFNNDRRIPSNLFYDMKSFLSGQYEIILITPDWKYYESIRESEKRSPGLRLDPYRQNKFYHIKRSNKEETQVDSLSRAMELQPFTINYKKTVLKENEVTFYFTNLELPEYTTDEKAELDKLNTQLQVNVFEGIYKDYTRIARMRTIKGEEERHMAYYTLLSLPLEKKLVAIKAMQEILQSSLNHSPKIYLPYTVIKNQ